MTEYTTMTTNPYTCRLLIRMDAVLYRLKGKRTWWSKQGKLCVADGRHNGEARTHFPNKAFLMAANIQNRWLWSRRILSI